MLRGHFFLLGFALLLPEAASHYQPETTLKNWNFHTTSISSVLNKQICLTSGLFIIFFFWSLFFHPELRPRYIGFLISSKCLPCTGSVRVLSHYYKKLTDTIRNYTVPYLPSANWVLRKARGIYSSPSSKAENHKTNGISPSPRTENRCPSSISQAERES